MRLKTKQIRGAALDVFWQEPPAKDDPILQFTNVSLSPHTRRFRPDHLVYGLVIRRKSAGIYENQTEQRYREFQAWGTIADRRQNADGQIRKIALL